MEEHEIYGAFAGGGKDQALFDELFGTDLAVAVAAVIAQRNQLLAALESVEWVADDVDTEDPDILWCPWCGNYQRSNHMRSCPRQLAIAAVKGE